ncbi:hypothetical protein MKZ38_009603 [Zalerion maritima]|uniref:Uncharacterized protein n=1 Tax=Zalerion maritima TaxID=339359 RepID=A0AAD5RGQ4_9PEZI|nr:hypothetical protein MKZ38_009603 [Zalerion maritima]
MEGDNTNFGSPANATSPSVNPILAQLPVLADAPAPGDDVQMTEASGDPATKQENTPPAPGAQDADMAGAQQGAKEGQTKEGGDETKSKENMENAAREHLISQTQPIVLPSYSTWFDMNAVHNIERKGLPEFFNNRNRSKTENVYKDYRNFMVNTYRLNPSEYLTVTACRRNLAGDVCAIMRVHAFLEQWGLINYQVDPDVRPSHVGPPFTGHFKIICDTPRGLQPWHPHADSIVLSHKSEEKKKEEAEAEKVRADTEAKAKATLVSKEDSTLEVGRNTYEAGKGIKQVKDGSKTNGDAPTTNGVSGGEEGAKKTEPVYCAQCGVDCTRIYYTNFSKTKPAPKSKHELCASCFVEGRLPANHNSSEFVRVDNPAYKPVDRDGKWSDAEIVRLLEGIERYDEDWGQIADHVGSRTREECVLQFLQMDIEGKYLESELPLDAPTGLNMLGDAGGYAPFNQADNPVMSVIGFLASLADPSSTAAAANRTVDSLVSGLRRRVEGVSLADSPSDKGKEKEPEAEKEKKNGESMDIDVRQETTTMTVTATKTMTTATTRKPAEAVALAVMAGRAGGLASNEEREMTRLNSAAVNITLQKMELKLKYFNEMEAILQAERRELERGRQQLFLDRLAFKQRVRQVQDGLKAAAAAGEQDGANMAALEALPQGEKMSFGSVPPVSSTQPLSSEGQIKTFET